MTADPVPQERCHDDLVQQFGSPFIVVGFYTPNYAEAAAKFAANLSDHGISHHIYARMPLEGGWSQQTRQKPSVLAEARKAYPDKLLVLMDVDCRVRGNIDSLAEAPGDVALRIKRTSVGSLLGARFGSHFALRPCSRVMLVRPTPGSEAFVGAWKSACDSTLAGCDESLLMQCMADSPYGYSVGTLPLGLAGLELRDAPPEAMIVHDSIRDCTRPAWGVRKTIRKYFRIARNAAFRLTTGKTYDEIYPKRGHRIDLGAH